MKLKIKIAVAVGFMALLTPNSALAVVPPQPISPVDGALVTVDPINGVTLTISAPEGVGKTIWVAASQNPATYPSGGFVDPLAVTAFGELTHDPNIQTARIARYNFPESGISTRFSGESGRVYWYPYVDGCEEVSGVYTCGQHYGATRSFLYDLRVPSAPPREEGASQPPPSTTCQLAKRRQRRIRVGVNIAQRRYEDARRQSQRRTWHARLRYGKKLLRRAGRETRRACNP